MLFLLTLLKCHDKSNLGDDGFITVHSTKVQSVIGGNILAPGVLGNWAWCMGSREGKIMNTRTQ